MEQKPIFFHNPKAAGTTINKMLGDHILKYGHIVVHNFKQVSPGLFRDCFKFVIVRNPWDRFVSTYTYAKQENNIYHDNINPKKGMFGKHPDYDIVSKINFEEYVQLFLNNQKKLEHQGLREQHLYTHIHDELAVDIILEYENLQNDVNTFCDLLIIKRVELTQHNVSRKGDYHEYYTKESWNAVKKIYAKDIELFGYEDDRL